MGSDRFEPLARQVASSLGAAWLPEVVVGHPIGGRTEADLRGICDDAWVGLQDVLVTFDGDAGVEVRASSSVPSADGVESGAAGRSSGQEHEPPVAAALDRLQTMIDEGYRLELVREGGGASVLHVIAEDEACADCLVPDEVLRSILVAEVEKNGGSLGEVRVAHGPPQ